MSEKIYDSIFDVIEQIDCNSFILECKRYHDATGLYRVLIPHDHYELVDLNNGKGIAIHNELFWRYFRGEENTFKTCQPSYFRLENDIERMVADIKAIEFEIALKKMPNVIFTLKDGMHVDFLALAQHYGIATQYLDLTTNLAVAAFFSCFHFNDDGTIVPSNNEYGQIKVAILNYIDLFQETCPLQIIGLQPFMRPGRQDGVMLRMNGNDDFSKISKNYIFKHNEEDTRIIQMMFSCLNGKECTDRLWLFPNEYVIQVAQNINNRNFLSTDAVKLYCTRNNKDYLTFKELLVNNNFKICDLQMKN